jgi:hypothetical protein
MLYFSHFLKEFIKFFITKACFKLPLNNLVVCILLKFIKRHSYDSIFIRYYNHFSKGKLPLAMNMPSSSSMLLKYVLLLTIKKSHQIIYYYWLFWATLPPADLIVLILLTIIKSHSSLLDTFHSLDAACQIIIWLLLLQGASSNGLSPVDLVVFH